MAEAKSRWEIILTRQAEKTLYRLSKPLLHRIDQALLALAENPRPSKSRRLAGSDNLYRLPLDDWRIAYAVEDERRVVLILEIASKQQPQRYRLEEESGQDVSPERTQQAQTNDPFITYLRPQIPGQFGPQFGTFEDMIRARGSSLLKRIERRKIRLLIVDDMPETRENLRKLLFIEADMEVVGEAATGEEAVQLAAERQPDVVLMDILMPGMDGLAAAEAISQQLPSTQIIMMSVHGEADYLRRAMLAGAKEFLIKPFSGDELLTSIRRVYQAVSFQRQYTTPEAPSIRTAFEDLKARIQDRLMADLDPTMDISRPDELGRTILQNKFDQILSQENIILSRSERTRLFESIVAEILDVGLDESQKRTLAQWFKFFKLGNKVEISLSVVDLAGSLEFYKNLGLERVDGGQKPYPWAVVSDGLLHLGLHQQEFASPTLSYFALHMLTERMDHLPKLGIVLKNLQKIQRTIGMYNSGLLHKLHFVTAEFASPEGQRVLLADIAGEVETTPAGRKFFSKYEACAELSLNTRDITAVLAYWKKVGFECIAEGDQPYPWVIISDGLIRLGLHQSPKLTKPTITYFAPDMPERLKRMRRRGIKFVAEHKDKKRRTGAVIESPDGQQFFFFTGEVKAKGTGQTTNRDEAGQEVDLAEASPRPADPQWYLIYSYSKNEDKVRQNLLQRVQAMGLQDKIFRVIVPPDPSVARRISGGSSFLSGSLLVEMVPDEDAWYVVKNTPGVTGFVGAGNIPTPLPPAEVDELLKYQRLEESKINGSFKIGQKVRIVEGPFADFMGIVDAVDQKQARVKVQLSFFGGEKLIEFDFLQVERA